MTQDDFTKSKTIPIECPEHGVFMQSVTAHLCGEGCPYCSHSIPISFDEFIRRLPTKHKEKGYISLLCSILVKVVLNTRNIKVKTKESHFVYTTVGIWCLGWIFVSKFVFLLRLLYIYR